MRTALSRPRTEPSPLPSDIPLVDTEFSRASWAAATAAPVAFAMAVSQTWFRTGSFIAQGDIPPFIRTSFEPEHTWAWNHDLTGAGSPTFQIVKSFEVLVIRAVDLFGGGGVSAQRVYYAILLGLTALGGACFARRFTRHPQAVALAGVFACLNAFVLTQVPNPLVLAAIGLMGLAGSIVVGAAQGGRRHPLLLAVTNVGFSYLLVNPPLLVMAVVWVGALVALGSALGGPGGFGRAAALVARALPWAVVLNLWWLVPAVPAFLGGGAPEVAVGTDVRSWAWTHVRGSIPNVLALNGAWTWTHPEYTPFAAKLDRAWWSWLQFVPPAACFAAPVVTATRYRRQAILLLSGVVLLVLVGKGVHPPLSGLNLLLYDHVPGFWLLREPLAKVGPALVLLYAALVGIALSALLDRFHGPRARRRPLGPSSLIVAAAAAAVVAFPYPLWNGTLIPGRKPVLPSAHVKVPDAWQAAADYLNAEPARGKALVLPLADFYQVPTTWGYYGTDVIPAEMLLRPTVHPLPQNYFAERPAYLRATLAIERALVEDEVEQLPGLLRALGVSHVLVRHDIDRSFPGRSLADPAVLERSLAASRAVRHDRSFDIVDVYAVTGQMSGLVQLRSAPGPAPGRTSPPPRLSWEPHNPTKYSVEITGVGRPVLLVLAEAFDPGWRVSKLPAHVGVHHQLVDDYANGWLLDGAGRLELTIEYAPARRARAAVAASSLGAVAALATILPSAGTAWRRRHGRRRPRWAHTDSSLP